MQLIAELFYLLLSLWGPPWEQHQCGEPPQKNQLTTVRSQEKIKQLEERVANLETIITSENINWQSLIESSPKNAVLNEDSSSIEEIEQPK